MVDRPDWYSNVALSGQYGIELIPVAVDENGNMICLIKGKHNSSLIELAVDADGQLITVPRGQSGNYLAVDGDGYLSSIMKGLDGATLRTVAVDGSGNILGVLKGLYDDTLKTIAVDENGIMMANLSVQSLEYMTARLQQGKQMRDYVDVNAVDGEYTTVYSFSGNAGVLHSITVRSVAVADAENDRVRLYMDNDIVHNTTFYTAKLNQLFLGTRREWCLIVYDEVNDYYEFQSLPELTFLNSFHISYQNNTGSDHNVRVWALYAFV